MFSASKILSPPPNSRQLLWRYFPYERLLDLLVSEELFFAHLPVLSDGLEGSLTERTRDKLFRWFHERNGDAAVAHREVALYEKHQEAFFVNCWHMNNVESYLMWKVYADRGFAVRTTFERIQAAFEPFKGSIAGGVVEYIDFERDTTELGNVFSHVITKDLPYIDEREFRLLFWRVEPKNTDTALSSNGVRVRVDLQMLIDKIYVSPLVKRVPSELRDLLEGKGIKCSIAPSAINDRRAL